MTDLNHELYYKIHECVSHFILYDFRAKAAFWIVFSSWQKLSGDNNEMNGLLQHFCRIFSAVIYISRVSWLETSGLIDL